MGLQKHVYWELLPYDYRLSWIFTDPEGWLRFCWLEEALEPSHKLGFGDDGILATCQYIFPLNA